jgi:xanthine permease XanP
MDWWNTNRHGIVPHVGSLLRALPASVLGGATIVMFGTVAIAGIKILSTVNMNRRNMLILAVSFWHGTWRASCASVCWCFSQ